MDGCSKVMNVMDPLYSKNCPHPPTEERDQLIAWKLHDALFNCLNEFYPGCNDDWSINFPVLMDTIFTCEETGGCIIHITRQYDGNKRNLPLTKKVSKTKMEALHECLKLQGNLSALANEALSKVLAPSGSAFEL